MKKKIHIPELEEAAPKTSSFRTPSGITAVSPEEIFAEYLSGGICRHLKPDVLLLMQRYDGASPLEVCPYLSPVPARYQLTDSETPYHCNDFPELIYVVQGEISVTIEQKTHLFAEHEIFLLRPSVFYQENRPDSHAVILKICLRPDYFEKVLRPAASDESTGGFLLKSLLTETGRRQFLHFTPETEEEKKRQDTLFFAILKEYAARQPGFKTVLQGLLIRLFSFLASGYPFSFTDTEKKLYRRYLFHDVEAYMEQNYFDMQMSDLSERFHYQTNYFNLLIQEFTGKTYSEYLICIRLRIARDLLERTDDGIEDIMHCIGYNNKGFFYRMFREEYDMTPAAYRKKIRQGKK